ncbi:MAG: MATE family efflux transporter [Tissierellia bacterium]|nr:MATE family efflux transporter [Tissierellia bacterium]
MNIGEERSKLLGTTPVGKLLFSFSVPAIFGMLINALYNIVDRIFLGQVGKLAIGGVFVTFPITLSILAFNMLIGLGGNSLSSIRLGQNRRKDAEVILGNAFTLLLLLAFVVMLILRCFLEPLLSFFGASQALLPYARDYAGIIILGIPLQSVSFGLNHFIRGEGNPKMAMSTMLIGAITNIILDYIFIVKFHMGVKGAAFATITGQGLSALWVLRYFYGTSSLLKLKLKNMALQREIVGEILALGIAPFSMQLVNSLVTTLLNRSLQFYGGDLAVTSMGVIHSISTFAFMPIFGLNQGSQPILGFNYGAKNYKRMKSALYYAISAATIYMALAQIIIFLFHRGLIGIFVPHGPDFQEILPIVKPGLLLWHATLPILGIQIIGSNYFQATGKPKIGTFLSLTRQLLILIPLIFLLPRFFGLSGIWYAVVTSDILSTLLTSVFLLRNLRQYPNIDKIKADPS